MDQDKTPTPPSAAQRKNLRSPLIVLKVTLDEGTKSFFGYSKNISRNGIFIGTVNPREPGSQFQVEMNLPAPIGVTIQCTCEVVWKRPFTKGSPYEPGMGLKFLDLPPEIADAIGSWVEKQASQG